MQPGEFLYGQLALKRPQPVDVNRQRPRDVGVMVLRDKQPCPQIAHPLADALPDPLRAITGAQRLRRQQQALTAVRPPGRFLIFIAPSAKEEIVVIVRLVERDADLGRLTAAQRPLDILGQQHLAEAPGFERVNRFAVRLDRCPPVEPRRPEFHPLENKRRFPPRQLGDNIIVGRGAHRIEVRPSPFLLVHRRHFVQRGGLPGAGKHPRMVRHRGDRGAIGRLPEHEIVRQARRQAGILKLNARILESRELEQLWELRKKVLLFDKEGFYPAPEVPAVGGLPEGQLPEGRLVAEHLRLRLAECPPGQLHQPAVEQIPDRIEILRMLRCERLQEIGVIFMADAVSRIGLQPAPPGLKPEDGREIPLIPSPINFALGKRLADPELRPVVADDDGT